LWTPPPCASTGLRWATEARRETGLSAVVLAKYKSKVGSSVGELATRWDEDLVCRVDRVCDGLDVGRADGVRRLHTVGRQGHVLLCRLCSESRFRLAQSRRNSPGLYARSGLQRARSKGRKRVHEL